MDGLQFEHRCAELLRYRGFHKVTVTKGSGDQGVDILAQKNGIKFGIQCKYYSHPVGNKAIQEAYAGTDFYDCDKAMVMTNSTFTKAARELADKLEVELWEHCSPNGSSSFLSKSMRIFNIFFLICGIGMFISSRLLNFPDSTILNYMSLLMLIFAALTGLIGWNFFLTCIISGLLYFGYFLLAILPVIFVSDSNWYGLLLLLPSVITVTHALYARFRNKDSDQ